MNYSEMLRDSAQKSGGIVCMGADPVLEKIPLQEKSVEKKISDFFVKIIDAAISEGAAPAAIKPNYAFYAQYGWDGLRALHRVCEYTKKNKIPLILDAKRGDIGKTNEAYAKEVFEFWGADCVTLSPFLGSDSVLPFVKWCEEKGKGVYLLNRTSNPGAAEIQNLICNRKEFYSIISEKIVEWGKNAHGNAGAVVGATSIAEFEKIVSFFVKSGAKVPLLIPGVGAQGGSAAEVTAAMKKSGYELALARINSSSGINYAYEKEKTSDFAGAAVREIKKMNKEIGALW
ncbi:MAG: orotidine-5'-phosphate decarboxylase [Candidatus Diapherotrites archaeon]|nr:orotidine-5'-phosphate decarboxylase [Candidatus Diapherotrites archaeon]